MIEEHEEIVSAAVRRGPMLGEMVLSVRQPWAGLIVQGYKPVENRSRTYLHRGIVWIHASSAIGDNSRLWEDAAEEVGFALSRQEWLAVPDDRGAIIGCAYLAGCWPMEQRPAWMAGLPHAEGPFCLWFSAAEECEPVALKGRLGLFPFPADHAASR